METLIESEIEIDAPARDVYEILIDLDRYPEWNPFTPRVFSTLEVGATVWLFLAVGRVPWTGWRILAPWPERVRDVEPGRRMCWGIIFGWRRIFCAERIQTLEVIDGERTRYHTLDRMTGWLAPLVVALFGRGVDTGFREVALALKKRAENRPVGNVLMNEIDVERKEAGHAG